MHSKSYLNYHYLKSHLSRHPDFQELGTKMDDQKRKKILAGGLAAVILVFLLRSTVDGWLRGPIRKLQSEVASAEASAKTLAADELQLEVARRNLQDWKFTSLPPDVDIAQRLYREWIQALAEECGFSRLSVVPASKSTQKEFSTIAVEVRRAEADLEGLKRFLFLFDQADMLHRISALTIDSPSPKGNPRLTVSFTAEGLSATGADPRIELLPRTPLLNAVKESDSQIVVAPNEAFPIAESPEEFEPFLVRIDRELLRVDAVTESGWKVLRAQEGTKAAAHTANAVVELFPVAWDRKEKTQAQYESVVKSSVFVIPSPPKSYTPRLTGVTSKTIKPGEEVKFTAKADGLDPELGEAQFALTDAAEGMQINPTTGEFLWTPPAELPSGEYTATVVMTQTKNPEANVDSKLKVTIKTPNTPPTITLKPAAVVVLEKEFVTTAKAEDADPNSTLTFSLGSGSPEGLKIDPKTGEIKWTPPKTFTPGKYDVEVKVTDSGDDPKTASAKIALDVQDDFAKLTILSGILGKDRVLYAWFRNKATDKVTPLKEGDKLTVSEIDAEVISISERVVKIKDAEGVWALNLGDVVRDRKLIEPAAPPVDSATPEAKSEASEETPSATTPSAPEETPTPTAPTPKEANEAPETPASAPAAPVPAETPAETPTPAPAAETPATEIPAATPNE